MPSPVPHVVSWTDHALVKAEMLGAPRQEIEDAVLARHGVRTRNTGAADWIVMHRGWVIAYNHPAGDELTALIVTLWRRS